MQSRARLYCVPPGLSSQFWPYVEGMLRGAERTRLLDIETVRRDVCEGGGLLWLAYGDGIDGAAVTSLQSVAGNLYCVITACGGHGIDHWIALIEGIEAYAKAEGCRAVRIIGRKGWRRKLPDYAVTNFVFERTL